MIRSVSESLSNVFVPRDDFHLLYNQVVQSTKTIIIDIRGESGKNTKALSAILYIFETRQALPFWRLQPEV